ncbi:hypothetical protein SUGI_0752930 [Cryptomeria japonica]|nr:hypothetical protein SUGI_0752930 [Cryptomeria japonica]
MENAVLLALWWNVQVFTNSYGAFPDRSIHKAAQAVFPSTEEELLAFVANAVKKQQKIRVVTKHSHSIPKLVCLVGETGLVISSSDLNHVVSVYESYMRMSVESATGLRDLIDSAAEHGLGLPHSP